MVDWAVDVVDTRQGTDLIDDGSGGREIVGREDDGGSESRDRRHVRLGEVVGALRIGAVEAIVDVGARCDHSTDDDDADERGDPDGNSAIAVTHGGGSKLFDHASHCEARPATTESGSLASAPGGYPHLRWAW